MRSVRIGLVSLTAVFWAQSADAGILPAEYRDVGVSVAADSGIPRDAVVTDEDGRQKILAGSISRPSILVFADYTCTTLCGPIIDFVASALEKSSLDLVTQFQLFVVGLDPNDTSADAARMRRLYLRDSPALDAVTRFVTADQATVRQLTFALGYRYVYDAEHDQFVHPAAAYVLRADGHVSRVLTGLGLSAADIRLALLEAGEGRIGTLGDQVRLLCASFDPQLGAYNLTIWRVLGGASIASALLLGGGIGLLVLSGRRRAT